MNSIVIGSKKTTSWKSFCRVVFADVTFRAERRDNQKYICKGRLMVQSGLEIATIEFFPFQFQYLEKLPICDQLSSLK